MKKIFHLIILLITISSIQAQKTIHSTILDEQTGTPLLGANIITNDGLGTSTDRNGNFDLNISDKSNTIEVSYIGYHPATIQINNINTVIKLNQAENQINQIVLSADRDKKERTEVPLAISLIPNSVIMETKPVALSELLNKASGIHMVELGNEQHSMSIRQPISYKSVFLYLEDGVPIRTTGVFNHNALIEINMNALRSIEVIKGAYSTLYGSEAIGGAINFITKDPTISPYGNISLQGNNLGYKKLKLGVSNTYGKLGIAVNGDFAYRKDGYRSHSDYNKFALNAKINYQFNPSTYLNNSVSFVDYDTDMTGGLDSAFYYEKNYASQQTFTSRKVKSFRFSSKLTHYWNDSDKSMITAFVRNNKISQNPHYRIKDDYKPWTGSGDKNLAHSEINENSFYSIGALLHHKKEVNFLNSSFSGGLSIDFSPNKYKANYIKVHKSDDKIYDSFEATDSLLSDYKVDLLNIGGYLQYEFVPINKMNVVASLRYDNFNYNYKNNLGSEAFSGAPDSKNSFKALTPKLGVTYEIQKNTGIYANYSNGFAPPQVGELYRGVKVPTLEPSNYNNYEVGTWFSLFKNILSVDLSYYILKGENEIISVKQDDGSRINMNAGSTNHTGLEYNIIFAPTSELSIRFSGAKSQHKFKDFIEKGKDFSGNIMPGAPPIIANSEIRFKPKFIKNLSLALEWQHIDSYYMNENNTKSYGGHDLFNVRIGYDYKNIGLWFHVLNITDKLYAASASSSQWGDSYRPGDPRTFNFGISYTIKK